MVSHATPLARYTVPRCRDSPNPDTQPCLLTHSLTDLAVSHRPEVGDVDGQQEEPQRTAQREDERACAPGQGQGWG